MPLTVETGIIVPSADSYISAADATTYIDNRGLAGWPTVEAEQEAALLVAMDFLRLAYRCKWSGARVTAEQPLDWPRCGVCVDGFPVSETVVPTDIQNAQVQYALRSLSGPLLTDYTRVARREKVGPMEIEYEADSDTQDTPEKTFTAINLSLKPYLEGPVYSFLIPDSTD